MADWGGSAWLSRDEITPQDLQRRCFISSSFKNAERVASTVLALREAGLFVYDFTKGNLFDVMRAAGVRSFEEAMGLPDLHVTAQSDLTMLNCLGKADVLLLILPAGFSAGWETGYAYSRGAHIVVCREDAEISDVPLVHADKICDTLDDAIRYVLEFSMSKK